jgi:hypothetical protein
VKSQREVAHRPRLVFRRTHLYPEPFLNSNRLQMCMPIIDTLDEKVHLEVPDEFRLIEVLQQKSSLPMAHTGQIRGRPSDLEPDS